VSDLRNISRLPGTHTEVWLTRGTGDQEPVCAWPTAEAIKTIGTAVDSPDGVMVGFLGRWWPRQWEKLYGRLPESGSREKVMLEL